MSQTFLIKQRVRLRRAPEIDTGIVRYTLDMHPGDIGRVHAVGPLGNGKLGVAVTFSRGTVWLSADDLESVLPPYVDALLAEMGVDEKDFGDFGPDMNGLHRRALEALQERRARIQELEDEIHSLNVNWPADNERPD